MIEFESGDIPVNSVQASICGSYIIQHLDICYFRAFYCSAEGQWYALGGGDKKEHAEWLCNTHAKGQLIPAKVNQPAWNPINWRTRDKQPEFKEGDRYLVAVALVDKKHNWYWETACVTIRHNEYSFDLVLSDGVIWEFDWTFVEYWMPLDKIINLLPRVSG